MRAENQYLGGGKAKLWTYIILLLALVVGVVVFNFAIKNPDLAKGGVDSFLGLPGFVFPIIAGLVGLLVFWLGLKIESDWPEALGALLIAGSVGAAEVMIGWDTFAFGGMAVVPYVLPIAVFLVLLAIGMAKSR